MEGDDLDIEWPKEVFTPGDFVSKYKLPQVVRLRAAPRSSGENGAGIAAPPPGPPPAGCLGHVADVRKPFLVYSQRRRTKGYARHMVYDTKTGDYVTDGTLVEIPKDYAGFFEIVPTDSKHKPVHFSSIRAVDASRCKRFFVKTVLGGFLTSHLPNGDVKLLSKHMIYPGDVLQRVRTVTKRWRLRSESEGTEEHQRSTQTKYLLCVDLSGQEVCVPLAHPGTFCALYDRDTDCRHFVWRAEDLLTHFRLPVTVRLVFGWPPRLTDDVTFSGVLQIVDKRRSDTLVVYNFVDKATIVGELPLNMDVRLQPAKNQPEVAASVAYRAAAKRCDRGAYCYVINMKPLDVDYRHVMGTSPVTSPVLGRRSTAFCNGMMASAQDMWGFHIRDIFPPLDQKDFAPAWSITFRDPLDDRQGNVPTTEPEAEEDDDPSGSERKRKAKLKRVKSLSGLNKADALEEIAAEMIPSFKDAPRSRVEESDNREARC